MARKKETRDRLEAVGLNPIPVHHPLNDGWDHFDEPVGAYDRMCWGNVVHAPDEVRVRLVRTLAERHRRYSRTCRCTSSGSPERSGPR